MPDDDLLHRDVRLLDSLLGQVIVDQAGEDVARLVEWIRTLAHDRRAGKQGAEAALDPLEAAADAPRSPGA